MNKFTFWILNLKENVIPMRIRYHKNNQIRRRNAVETKRWKVKSQRLASVSVRSRHMTRNNRFNLKNWHSIIADFYLNVRLKYDQNNFNFVLFFYFTWNWHNTDEFMFHYNLKYTIFKIIWKHKFIFIDEISRCNICKCNNQ